MSTICPNCLRPVRADAKFCGFCGNNLFPAKGEDSSAMAVASIDETTISQVDSQDNVMDQKSKTKVKARRVALILIIILLCLVLLLAFLIHYWPIIAKYIFPS